jgi:hypothetical protein
MSRLTTSGISLIAFSLLIALPAVRATIIHSDVSGATVNFVNISEGAISADPEPLFGQPSASGDSLIFPMTASFSALSVDGNASDPTAGKVSFTMAAKSGHTITAFNYAEGGFTNLNAPFNIGDAFTQVVAFASVKILEVNNSPVTLPVIQQFLNISPLGGQYQLSSIGGTNYQTGWSGSLSIPLPSGTTKALVTIDNSLFAASLGSGSQALIGKTSLGVDIDTAVIPEPTTVLLGATVMLAWSLCPVRRRVR